MKISVDEIRRLEDIRRLYPTDPFCVTSTETYDEAILRSAEHTDEARATVFIAIVSLHFGYSCAVCDANCVTCVRTNIETVNTVLARLRSASNFSGHYINVLDEGSTLRLPRPLRLPVEERDISRATSPSLSHSPAT
jgi:hypothetical protein